MSLLLLLKRLIRLEHAIRKVNKSIRIYGARSVSNDEINWRYITMQIQQNSLRLVLRIEWKSIISTIDSRGNPFGLIRASIKAFLNGIALQDGLCHMMSMA